MYTNNMAGVCCGRQSGISLIELVMFIIIVSVGLVGILSVMTNTARSSADPMLYKQAIAIAESLMEEITQQAFTFCDPTDANATTAGSAVVGAGGCAVTVEAYGPEAGESRYSTTAPLNNVNDYGGASSSAAGFSMAGIRGVDGVLVSGLGDYTATVTIQDDAITSSPVVATPAADSLRINVRVTAGNTVDVTLTGYRLRYAPNTAP
jgi:MSHA pilin protein MshD